MQDKQKTVEQPKASQPDPKLLELLVCPQTKAPLVYNSAANELISVAANVAYPIRDGIPVMLEDEARPLSADEKARYKPTKATKK